MDIGQVVYLDHPLDRKLGDIRMEPGLALEIIDTMPLAFVGRYNEVMIRPGFVCRVVGRPELRICLPGTFLAADCPEESTWEGMARPGHVYEWERT